LFYIMRVTPLSASRTQTSWEVFGRKGIPMGKLKEINQFYLQIQSEDIELCKLVQTNLNLGAPYSRGVLQPDRESGVIYFQRKVREYCANHLQQEKAAGRRIYPAIPRSQREEEVTHACDHEALLGSAQATSTSRQAGEGGACVEPKALSW
jgi:hypothetical protein